MAEKIIKTNRYWNDHIPFVCIITPTFNRRMELQRCMESVQRQTYQDIEYIIINDGSQKNVDDIVETFMDQAAFPVMYIKKENGGVHTARNLGIKYARAEMIFFIDDDDEIIDDGLELLVNTWNQLPDKERYANILGRCVDQNGDLVGELFPDDINSYPERVKVEIGRNIDEVVVLTRASVLKMNLWPEVGGITFVNEDVVWGKLRKEYGAYCTNYLIRIYHRETEISILKGEGGRPTLQNIKNAAYGYVCMLNTPGFYAHCGFLEIMIRFCTFDKILRRHYVTIPIELKGTTNKILYHLLYVPSWGLSAYYIKKKMKK